MSEPPAESDQSRSSYQVLARRFRPARFGDVVGQEGVIRTLQSCLNEGRVPHAFLFCGSRGVGKTTSARILARAVNCEKGVSAEPCGECAACREILAGTASDVVELDAASHNGVDEVRALREQAGYAPLRLRKKVFVLDEVHMFSRSAFNALLKILEEPPEHVIFVLATTELHKVPDTVRSRCQVLTFRRIQEKDIRARLAQIAEQEGVAVDPEILGEIAASSLGGLRDAETALERMLPLAAGLDLEGYRRLEGRLGFARTSHLVKACLAGDTRAALNFAFEAAQTGVDERECLGEVLAVLRQLFVLRVDGPETVLLEASGESRERLLALAKSASLAELDARMQILILARDRIRQIDDRRVFFELTLVRLAQISELMSLGEIAAGAAAETGGGSASSAPLAAAAPAAVPTPASRQAPAPSSAQTPSRPAANTAPSPVASAGDAWQRIVETALAEKKMIGALLGRAQLRWDGDARALLSFERIKAFDQRLLDSEHTKSYLQQLFTRVCARPVALVISTGGEEPAGGAAPAGGTASLPGGSGASQTSPGPSPLPKPQAASGQKPEFGRQAPSRKQPNRPAQHQPDARARPTPEDIELPPLGHEIQDLFGARFLEKRELEKNDDNPSATNE
ncbi:MAG: DNA polymerase III, subunit gamma and tau [Planctomycetota bacterium]|nr:MAG: DNA polymerase III, subunit gamma and tau [Planctomycetota bacterium]